MSAKFRKDFSRGNIGENAVKVLLGSPILCYKKNGHKDIKELSKYDFEITLRGMRMTGEIKRDWMESKTGRLAIEYHNPKQNKPSGLLGTSADFWIIVLENPRRVMVTTVKKLKEYCGSNKPVRDLLGGDDNAMLWLYDSKTLLVACFKELIDGADVSKLLEDLISE